MLGGSLEYCGAPFYAAAAALKCVRRAPACMYAYLRACCLSIPLWLRQPLTACVRVACGGVPQGADIAHILCAEEAAIPIKSFSPEVIVHPVLKTGEYG